MSITDFLQELKEASVEQERQHAKMEMRKSHGKR